MSYGLLGTLLLLLPGPTSAEGRNIQQSPRQLWVLPGETAELSCRVSDHSQYVNWYKEKPDGSLDWIYRNLNYTSPGRKYSGRSETWGSFSFTISSVQREDSGVYYCSSSNVYTLFGDGTRLVVTNASEPKLSILVPVDVEEPRQPLTSIPLLCHLHDLPPGWDTVRWQPGGEVTPVTAATVDKDGVLSAWSITWVSAEWWDGAAACTALENGMGKTISVTITKRPGEEAQPSWPLALGLSCVSLLFLLQLTILLCRRRLARGDPPPRTPFVLALSSCPPATHTYTRENHPGGVSLGETKPTSLVRKFIFGWCWWCERCCCIAGLLPGATPKAQAAARVAQKPRKDPCRQGAEMPLPHSAKTPDCKCVKTQEKWENWKTPNNVSSSHFRRNPAVICLGTSHC
ncbi:uncharacterized protein LOC126041276 [Accipiter gentilis]|uniref:uncharacterized protein LOC126041276 n=1 Tax=Astur gentilis TaxID=8957 RepID=UPI002110698C|nr:uncharacterized protein LOC126041276 [Accipiter gentilis]